MRALFFYTFLIAPALAAADLYERKPESWVWYQDPAPADVAPKEKPAEKGAVAEARSAKETLKLMGEAMEEAEAQSILNPTSANIKHAIEMKKQALALSQTYADRYEQVVWKNPELDYTIERPMRTDALYTASPLKQERLDSALAKASETNALVYVFRSDCPYCKKFSPVLKAFAAQHGFTILAFTLDGTGTADFPFPKVDVSQLRAKGMEPQKVPAVYVVNPKAGTTEAVGFGLMNKVDLENRVALAVGVNVYEGAASASGLQE